MCFHCLRKTIFFLKEPDSRGHLFHANTRRMSFAFLFAFISAADSLAATNHFNAGSFKAQRL